MHLSDEQKRRALGFAFLALLIASVLYGTSFQQFRHFDLSDTRGISDVHGYLEMAHGNFAVDPPHRYRPIVPWLAGALSSVIDPPEGARTRADLLSFYIVNYLLISAAAVFLFYFLLNVTNSVYLSFIGLMIFLGSRQTIIATATPVIESYHLCAIAAFAWLVASRRMVWLALTLPIMAWSKETMIPLLFLPLLSRDFRRWEFGLGLVVALASIWGIRNLVDFIYADHVALYEARLSGNLKSAMGLDQRSGVFQIFEVAWNGLQVLLPNIVSPRWWHAIQNGFALALPLAAAGLVISWRRRESGMSWPILAILPVAVVYQLVNEAGGRMLFTAFPVIIAFALIAVREILARVSFGREA
jgi:hypothetical protein